MPSIRASTSPSMSITQLLNPSSTKAPEKASRVSTRRQQRARPSNAIKHSAIKSGPRREIRGQVNFPPCEEECPELIQAYEEFSIRPDGLENAKFGDIASLPSSVPYTSSKKDFLEKTGRKSLEGYWVPFEAAKAIASTFCYTIRWALVPIFGIDFPAMCLLPEDPKFKSYMVNPEIIERAEAQAQTFLTRSGISTPASSFTPSQPLRSNLPERQQRIPSPPQETGTLDSLEPDAAARTKKPSSFSSFCPPTPQTSMSSPISTFSSDISNESAHVTLFSSPAAFESRGGSAFSTRPSSRDTSCNVGHSPVSKLRKSSKADVSCAVSVADLQDPLSRRSAQESEAAYALVELSTGLGSRKRSATQMDMAF
ncbi:hypothetical protein KEM54_005656 [Ascosphaera aggregata]|nr:hypothetical protein KEM54_005656 [Ascosphaera aggregata]